MKIERVISILFIVLFASNVWAKASEYKAPKRVSEVPWTVEPYDSVENVKDAKIRLDLFSKPVRNGANFTLIARSEEKVFVARRSAPFAGTEPTFDLYSVKLVTGKNGEDRLDLDLKIGSLGFTESGFVIEIKEVDYAWLDGEFQLKCGQTNPANQYLEGIAHKAQVCRP